MGLEGEFPANHAGKFDMGRRAVLRRLGRTNFRAACGLSIAGPEIWESVRRDRQCSVR